MNRGFEVRPKTKGAECPLLCYVVECVNNTDLNHLITVNEGIHD